MQLKTTLKALVLLMSAPNRCIQALAQHGKKAVTCQLHDKLKQDASFASPFVKIQSLHVYPGTLLQTLRNSSIHDFI